jgi:hypothetical protein
MVSESWYISNVIKHSVSYSAGVSGVVTSRIAWRMRWYSDIRPRRYERCWRIVPGLSADPC